MPAITQSILCFAVETCRTQNISFKRTIQQIKYYGVNGSGMGVFLFLSMSFKALSMSSIS